MASEMPIVTIAGAAGVGKKSIAARLLDHADGHEASLPCTWRLDTKYYTADVQIRVVTVSPEEPCSSHIADSEALLLIFDVTEEESMHSLQRWMEGLTGDLPDMCLMLANRVDLLASADSSALEASWHEQAQDWCCHNLFEYIEVSAVDAEVDASLSRDGDRQGVRRIVSALQAHTWPGLRMKPQSEGLSTGIGVGRDTEDSLAAASHATQARFHSSAAADLEHSPVHSSASAAAAQQNPDAEQMGAWQAAAPEPSSRVEHAHDQSQRSAAGSMAKSQLNGHARDPGLEDSLDSADELSEDGGLEEFESTMRQLQQGRDRLQGLPDDERRARAASMAAQMMQALGINDEDTDDDSQA